MRKIAILNYMYLICWFFFLNILFNSKCEHTQYKPLFSITLYSVFILICILFCWKLSRFGISTVFKHAVLYIYLFLEACFLNLRQISSYRHHYKISALVYYDMYMYLYLVTGTIRSKTGVGKIMEKGAISLSFYD